MGALGTLLDLKIDYFAQVNLGGFVNVVNTLGGINVDVADGFCDPTYDEYGFTNGFAITAGRHHLNGNQALAFARVRKAAGESDFTRAARQQEVLSGIRDAVKSGGFLRDPVGFMKAVGKTVVTNIPRKLVPDIAEIAARVGRTSTLPGGHQVARSCRRATTRADRSRSRTSRRSAPSPRRCSTRPARSPPAKYQTPKSSGKVSGSGVSSCARLEAEADPEAHPEADPKTDGDAGRDAGAHALADPTPSPNAGPDAVALAGARRARARPDRGQPASVIARSGRSRNGGR